MYLYLGDSNAKRFAVQCKQNTLCFLNIKYGKYMQKLYL